MIDPVLLERLDGLARRLGEPERADAERLLELARAALVGEPAPRAELDRLRELLSRRSARALPFAALSRALLARAASDEPEAQRAVAEVDQRLTLLDM